MIEVHRKMKRMPVNNQCPAACSDDRTRNTHVTGPVVETMEHRRCNRCADEDGRWRTAKEEESVKEDRWNVLSRNLHTYTPAAGNLPYHPRQRLTYLNGGQL